MSWAPLEWRDSVAGILARVEPLVPVLAEIASGSMPTLRRSGPSPHGSSCETACVPTQRREKSSRS